MSMSILTDVKNALRVSSKFPEDEVNDLIEAGKLDLRLAGVYFKDEDVDPLIKRAIITYCKANFGYDNPDADRFQKSYTMLKQHLSLAGDYHEPME